MHVRSIAVPGLFVGILAMAVPAFAGPPLLCHPYDIGQACCFRAVGLGLNGLPGVLTSRTSSPTPWRCSPRRRRSSSAWRRCVAAALYASQDGKAASALLDQ